MGAPSHKLASTLCLLLAGLLVPASTASADIGVVGLNPHFARPGERVDLTVGCGACPADTSFPISLVPVEKSPRPHPCGENAVCYPTALRPPGEPPFVFLGTTSGGRALLPTVDPPGSKSDLRFAVPKIDAGRYAFVVFCADCVRGPRGSLLANTTPGNLLRILPSDAAMDSGGGGSGVTWWIVAGIGTVALVLAVVLLLRRRQAV